MFTLAMIHLCASFLGILPPWVGVHREGGVNPLVIFQVYVWKTLGWENLYIT